MQKDQRLNLDDARDKLKQAGVAEDEMAALERQLAPVVDNGAAKDKNRRVGFVSAGVESQSEGGIKVTANHEDIELPEESDSDDDGKVEITQKDVPSAVFGGLVRKRDEANNDAEAQDATALERIKRLKKAWLFISRKNQSAFKKFAALVLNSNFILEPSPKEKLVVIIMDEMFFLKLGGWELMGEQLVKEKKLGLEILPLNFCQADFSIKSSKHDISSIYWKCLLVRLTK